MQRSKVTIINKLGLHARAAARFVAYASRFACQINVIKGERSVNGKSIMGIMMLAAKCGSELELETDGEDEVEAINELLSLISDRFGEGE